MKPSSFSVPLKVHSITVGELQTNCYFIFEQSTKNCVIIDPGAEGEKIEKEIKKKGLNVVAIVNTHGHPDHISANGYLKKVFSCPIYIHQLDSVLLENSKNSVISEIVDEVKNLIGFLRPFTAFRVTLLPSAKASSFLYSGNIDIPPADEYIKGEKLKIGELEFEVIHTPGHTPGSICLVGNNFVITGDTLFCGSVGRCDLPGGDESKLMGSLKKLLKLPADYAIYPGHGPQCTIGGEMEHNPFVPEL